jgi:hypothetical protein
MATPEEKFQQLIEIKRAERDSYEARFARANDELVALENAYDVAFGDDEVVALVPVSRRGRAQEIMAVLRQAPPEGLTVGEIAARVGGPRNSLKTRINVWHKAGRLVRVSTGRYRAAAVLGTPPVQLAPEE